MLRCYARVAHYEVRRDVVLGAVIIDIVAKCLRRTYVALLTRMLELKTSAREFHMLPPTTTVPGFRTLSAAGRIRMDTALVHGRMVHSALDESEGEPVHGEYM